MKPLITILFVILLNNVFAQVQPYGVIDTADLKLKECNFEKDANAMVLFDKGEIISGDYSNDLIRHMRIKIFNEKGGNAANIRLVYISKNFYEEITDVKAQTVNMEGDKISITPIDKKQLYIEKIDKYQKAIVFTLPRVRAGSVIDIQYKWSTRNIYNYPSWYFQSSIPVKYSELSANLRGYVSFLVNVKQEFEKAKRGINAGARANQLTWALSNMHSYTTEPYMVSADDFMQSIIFYRGGYYNWSSAADKVIEDVDFGRQINSKLTELELFIKVADTVQTQNKKIELLFNKVRDVFTWDATDEWYTVGGLRKAWNKKTGNSTEINLILYKMLSMAGVKSFPVLVSTPDNGKVEARCPGLSQFNKTVICIPVDSAFYYILDASDKKSKFNEIPYDLLNTYGLGINFFNERAGKKNKNIDNGRLFQIKCFNPVREIINMVSEIGNNGKMNGSVRIENYSYSRNTAIAKKEEEGEKYKSYIKNNDNEVTVTNLNFENLETDTLPLIQNIDFVSNLTNDDNYIYFNVNLFSAFRINPFLSEERYSDIEFNYPIVYTISGLYKIPENYKIEAIPKPINIRTSGNDISIRRIVGQEGGRVFARYIIERRKDYYTKEEYPALKEFYQKMFEILNEPIVLKKMVN